MMAKPRQALGRWGENLASEYLQKKGYQILDRNARTEFGEIDLVARGQEGLVFVEVKARTSKAYGEPEAAVTPAKQQHLQDAAEAYLQAHPGQDGAWRIDVIAIYRPRGRSDPDILHIENAVTG